MTEALLILFGILIGLVPGWIGRRRKIKTHWAVLGAEVELCKSRAENYIRGSVIAPLYRLPVSTFHTSFPVLLSEGNLAPNEYNALMEFFSWAEDINRGLENADQMSKEDNNPKLKSEYVRNMDKCKKLTELYFEPAIQVIRRHLR